MAIKFVGVEHLRVLNLGEAHHAGQPKHPLLYTSSLDIHTGPATIVVDAFFGREAPTCF